MNFLLKSLTVRIKEQVKDQLPQILAQEVSNFAPPVIEKLIKESRDEVTLAKVSSQPQSTYEAASTLTEVELKKILLDKMEKSKSDLTALEHRDCYDGLKKSYALEEFLIYPIDFSSFFNGLKIKNLTQEILLGPAFILLKGTRSNYAELEYDFEEYYKALSEKLDWENPEGGDYLFDLSKPLPLITCGIHQRVPFKFFINNDLKYLQGGDSTMTYTTSTTKSKVAKYDLPGIEDMVPNIWSPIKVAYDRYALWGISHWREQHKSFYVYVRGIQSRGDVYSTKCILAVTHVKVMRKHGYGYLKEIIVRRADNILYRFKEDLRKRHPYTPYKDPHGFIYVDDYKRNRLMRSDELYKFSDGTLTRLLSSLEDITKNIDMEYLSKRRWSNLEKKRAHFMIKDINKLLKERRMMRSLEKFIGGRLYRTDLRLLQRTI
ncbi:hypothetical protein Tco_1412215 [Tanacetum coccineum]